MIIKVSDLAEQYGWICILSVKDFKTVRSTPLYAVFSILIIWLYSFTNLFKAPDRNPENIKIQGHLPHQMDISWEVRERGSLCKTLYTINHYHMKAFLKICNASVHCPVVAAVAYRTQRPRPRVQGELQETGGRRCLEGASSQKTLFCCEEHVHFRPLWDQDSEQEQPRLGTRT